ncbi:MAG: hypothetical protein JW741_02830 [Sedimentisphaerales bacterium]|nr:hypothetical protein [Sedimentisphaerales bacterium]
MIDTPVIEDGRILIPESIRIVDIAWPLFASASDPTGCCYLLLFPEARDAYDLEPKLVDAALAKACEELLPRRPDQLPVLEDWIPEPEWSRTVEILTAHRFHTAVPLELLDWWDARFPRKQ